MAISEVTKFNTGTQPEIQYIYVNRGAKVVRNKRISTVMRWFYSKLKYE